MSKITVGHLINRKLDKPTGTTIKCTEYARILSSKMNVNLFAVSNNSILKNKVKYSPVRRIFIPEYWMNRSFSGRKTLFSKFLSYTSGYRNILNIDSDILHCHATTTCEIAYLFREFTKSPMIYDVHGIVDSRNKKAIHREKIIFRDFEGIIVESDRTKKYILSQNRALNPEKIFVVSECVDLEALESNINDQKKFEIINKYKLEGKKIVMYGGVISDGVQDSMCLFRTLKRINKYYRDFSDRVSLVIISNKDNIERNFMNKINNYISSNNLTNITWIAPVPYSDLYNYYQVANVIICPASKPLNSVIATSTLEPLTKVFVAMGSSTPTVCSDLLGNRDLTSNGKNAVLVQPGNADDYAKAIISLFEDEIQAAEIGARGREKIINDHNPKLIGSKLENVYNSILTHRDI